MLFGGRGRRSRTLIAGVVALTAAIGVGAGPASAATDSAADELRPDDGAFFGSILDWATDSVPDQTDRLGGPSAVYGHSVPVPMTPASRSYLGEFLQQVAASGGNAVVSLLPSDLAGIDEAAAESIVDDLESLRGDSDTPLYLRFGPDMNGTWVEWGQDPDAYTAAFRTVADEVHDRLDDAAMVWSPASGRDYPFGPRRDAGGSLAPTDTDGDGVLGTGDDPYGPYFPGEDAVDWVGLSLYHDDTAGGEPVNTVPGPTELRDRLIGVGGTPDDDFIGRYAGSEGRPLLLETGAFFSPAAGGPAEVDIKRAWWTQAFDAAGDDSLGIGVVLWRDTVSTRAVVGESIIDWGATLDPDVLAAFRADVSDSPLRLGPIRDGAGGAGTGASGSAQVIEGVWAWVAVAAVLLAAGLLVLLATRGRHRARLAYDGPPNRDLRIDLLRGVAIVFVVVNHLGITSLLQNVTQEAVGAVSGAELFVLLSGVILGMVYRPKLATGGLGEVVVRTTRRAWTLYRTALVAVIVVFLLAALPFIEGRGVTTFTDEGTGAAGSEATGRVYDLYAGADALFSYPVPPQIIVDFALLRLGPWQINILGLYVVLLLVSPLVLWALSRRLGWVALAVSWSLWAVEWFTRIRVLPSQFEDSFPLLAWQALFVTGLVAGYHRREIVAFLSYGRGRAVLWAATALSVGFLLFSWSNPYLSSPLDVRLALIPDNEYRLLYDQLFPRTYLGVGRVLNLLALTVAAYALLTAFWRPISRVLGGFLIPLGQATLYVFVMHVFLALAVSSIPALGTADVWVGTIANIAILGLLWLMVRFRFLFSIVPR